MLLLTFFFIFEQITQFVVVVFFNSEFNKYIISRFNENYLYLTKIKAFLEHNIKIYTIMCLFKKMFTNFTYRTFKLDTFNALSSKKDRCSLRSLVFTDTANTSRDQDRSLYERV